MNKEQKQTLLVTLIVVLAIVLDQALKLYIRTHFYLGESHEILPFFQLCFIENDGMAFGIEWFSKIVLTLFRIAAVGALGWYIHYLIHRCPMRMGFLASVAFVMAGALGNILDCIFYGKLFDYAGWLQGKVVDMLYFPLITNASGECLFFRPVFNLADACITTAVIVILLFYRKDLDASLTKNENK